MSQPDQVPIPMRIPCEGCGELHIDEGEFATKPHHTHSCQFCGLTWRPAVPCTVGVRFLPGFKNVEPNEEQYPFEPNDKPYPFGFNVNGADVSVNARRSDLLLSVVIRAVVSAGYVVRSKSEIYKLWEARDSQGTSLCLDKSIGSQVPYYELNQDGQATALVIPKVFVTHPVGSGG